MATIIIGRSSSECGNCRRGASLQETGHYTNLGYSTHINGTPGCGEEWDDAVLTTWTGRPLWKEIEFAHFSPDHITELLRNHYWDEYPPAVRDTIERSRMDERWAGNW